MKDKRNLRDTKWNWEKEIKGHIKMGSDCEKDKRNKRKRRKNRVR